MNEAARKETPDIWLDAAYEVLIEAGVDAVRVASLAQKIGLSRASFYWAYKDREELLQALLDRWRSKNTDSIIRQSDSYADTIVEATLNVFDCWFLPEMFDSRLEFAVRSWAMQSVALQAELQSADRARTEAIKRMLTRFNMLDETAEVRARSVYLVQIGYISLHTDEDMHTRMKRVPDYVEMFSGAKPSKRELDRFFSRIGYTPANAAA